MGGRVCGRLFVFMTSIVYPDMITNVNEAVLL